MLLRANHTMYGARFSLGPDGDVYLVGRVALEHLTVEELDRIIGVLYELTDRWFQPVVRLAYPRPLAEVAETTSSVIIVAGGADGGRRVRGPRCRTVAPFGEVRGRPERSSGPRRRTRRVRPSHAPSRARWPRLP